MSKDYISPEHAIRKIMLKEDWKQNLSPEQRQEYIRKYGVNTAKWPNPQSGSSQEQQAQQTFSSNQQDSLLGSAAKAAGAIAGEAWKSIQPSNWAQQAAQSLRTDNLGTSNEPPNDSETSKTEPVTTEPPKPEVKVGYGDGKVDPRLASAAGIGPKLAGSEPVTKPDDEKPSSSVPASDVKPKSAMSDKPRVPNIKLASKLSDLNYTGMGAAARNEYLKKSAEKAWAKPTRENQSLRQRAQRQEYGPDR